MLSPVEFVPDEQGRVKSVIFNRTQFEKVSDSEQKLIKTHELVEIPAQLVIKATGYKYEEIHSSIPKANGHVANEQG